MMLYNLTGKNDIKIKIGIKLHYISESNIYISWMTVVNQARQDLKFVTHPHEILNNAFW